MIGLRAGEEPNWWEQIKKEAPEMEQEETVEEEEVLQAIWSWAREAKMPKILLVTFIQQTYESLIPQIEESFNSSHKHMRVSSDKLILSLKIVPIHILQCTVQCSGVMCSAFGLCAEHSAVWGESGGPGVRHLVTCTNEPRYFLYTGKLPSHEASH